VAIRDFEVSKAIVAKLEHNMSVATSTCILCLLHEHAGIEDDHIFPKVSGFEPAMVEMLIQEHREVVRTLVGLIRFVQNSLVLGDRVADNGAMHLTTIICGYELIYVTAFD
jgi:hypothetical protein